MSLRRVQTRSTLPAMTDSGTELIGFWAALLTTIAFAPQVLRTWRLGGHELSMLSLFGAGVTLWFVTDTCVNHRR